MKGKNQKGQKKAMFSKFKYNSAQKAHEALLKKYGNTDGTVNMNKIPHGAMRILHQPAYPPNFDEGYNVEIADFNVTSSRGSRHKNIGFFKTKQEALKFANGHVGKHNIFERHG